MTTGRRRSSRRAHRCASDEARARTLVDHRERRAALSDPSPLVSTVRSYDVIRGTSYLRSTYSTSRRQGSALLGVGARDRAGCAGGTTSGAAAFIGSRLASALVVPRGESRPRPGSARRAGQTTVTVTNNSSQLGAGVGDDRYRSEPVPALFARMAGIAGVRVARDFDLVARLGGHLSSSWQRGSFLSSTVGVRLRLP